MSIVGISLFSQVSADNITSSSWKTHYVRLMPTFSGNLHANVFLYFWLTLTFFPEKSDACFTVPLSTWAAAIAESVASALVRTNLPM